MQRVQEKRGIAEPAGVGRLCRPLLCASLRRKSSLQGQRVLHGLERRTSGQVARGERGELRRHIAFERRRRVHRAHGTGCAARSLQAAGLLAAHGETPGPAAGESERASLRRAVHVGSRPAPV